MVPHSLAVGGLMLAPDSGIASVADLKGKTIAVAGGPVDKSWVVLQPYYNKLTGATLTDDVTAKYGAPPLVNELLSTGGVQAGLNFWHWNARSKAVGLTELALILAVTVNKLPLVISIVREGVRSFAHEFDELADVFRMSAWRRLRLVFVPQLVPFVLAAARTGLSLI
jgi:ABC-type proline/glycine betaine transport system permease subunit